MGIYKIINELKDIAISSTTVSDANYGDISLYDNKTNIKYPYVNFDVINTRVQDSILFYNIRIYVMDRNEPYIAYNKTELILNTILKNILIDANTYTVNYFTLNFKDLVNGCWTDFEYAIENIIECLPILPDGEKYIITEDLDYIITEDTELNIITEN